MNILEYLYKGKRLDNREWIIGFITFHKTGKVFIKPIDGSATSSEEVDKDTICRCTGLKDKNGNLIWENDIVKKHFYEDYDACVNSEEYIGVVKYTNCAWIIDTFRGGEYKCAIPVFEVISYSEDIKYFEIIGNTIDNPELLESEE